MVSINNKDNYIVTNKGISQKDIQKTIAQSSKSVSDSFESNSIGQVLKGDDDSASKYKKILMVVPPLLIFDNIFDSLFNGQGNKSLLKKVSNVGDKISHIFKLDSLFSQKSGSKIKDFVKNNRFLKYFTSEYSAIPRTSMARTSKMSEKYVSEIISTLSKIANDENFSEIASGLSKETLNILNSLSDTKVAGKLQPENLIKASDELLSKGIDKISAGSLLKKSESLSGARNKLAAAASKMGNTSIGKALSKGLLKAKDVVTYGGGFLSMCFMASALINAVKATKEAPKGEKKSTFMHVLSEQYLGIILFQPSISLMYKIAGNKYRGMSVEARETLKNLVKSTNANEALTKEGLKLAKLQKKLLLKGVDKDKVTQLADKTLSEAKNLAKGLKKEGAKIKFWEKPLKFAGNILSAGLDKLKKPTVINLKKKIPFFGNKIKIPKPTLTGFAGGLARFAIIMFVIQPFLQKPITKLVHKIFGEPKSYLAKQEAANNSNNDKNKNQTQNQTQNPEQISDTNLINNWVQKINSEKLSDNNSEQSVKQPSAENVQQPADLQKNDVSQDKPEQLSENKQTTPAALNLFNKDSKNGSRYIPVVEQHINNDNLKDVEKQVELILKNTEQVIKQTKKYI